MKKLKFKTLVKGNGEYREFIWLRPIPQVKVGTSATPSLIQKEVTLDILKDVYPDIDFSEMRLVDIEVIVKEL